MPFQDVKELAEESEWLELVGEGAQEDNVGVPGIGGVRGWLGCLCFGNNRLYCGFRYKASLCTFMYTLIWFLKMTTNPSVGSLNSSNKRIKLIFRSMLRVWGMVVAGEVAF